jgi:hypothetical protein
MPPEVWEEMTACHVRTAAAGGHVERLADLLGVRADSLTDHRVGYIRGTGQLNDPPCWTWPERDGDGQIIGIGTRGLDGEKRCLRGSSRGLIYADDWAHPPGPIFLVEGLSDTAALATKGLCVIGRPSNRGGTELLTKLLANVPADRPIIVVSENDQKADGTWPGREGARCTAQRVAQGLGRRVYWSMPPVGAKDSRAWLNARKPDLNDLERLESLGERYARILQKAAVECVPTSTKCVLSSYKDGDNKDYKNSGHISLDSGAIGRILSAGSGKRPCPAGYVPLLQHRQHDHLGAAKQVGCRRLSCYRCGPQRKKLWLAHLLVMLHAHRGRLYLWRGPKGRAAKSAVSIIRRRSGEYVRVEASDGQTTIVSTKPVKKRSAILLAGPAPAAEEVAAAMEHILVSTGDGKKARPISASPRWQLHEERIHRWRRRGAASHGRTAQERFDNTVELLKRKNFQPSVTEKNDIRTATWDFPKEYNAIDIAMAYDDLVEPPVMFNLGRPGNRAAN